MTNRLPRGLRTAALGALALLLAAGGIQHAAAQEDNWSFSLSPYLWAAGLDGDVRIGSLPTASVDLSFSDIFDDLNGAVMLNGEAHKGRFMLEGDLMYVKTVSKEALPVPEFSGLRYENTMLVLTAIGGYRLLDSPQNAVDVFAGLRHWSLEGDLRFDGGTLPTVSASSDKSWTHPIVGARGMFAIAQNWSVTMRGTLGGFGIGADSEWSAFGGVTYKKSDKWSFTAGYRHLAVDYDKSNLLYDVALSGPMAGLTYRF